MQSVLALIRQRFQEALVEMLGESGRDVDPLVRPSQDAKFGDYQSNCAMGLAKTLGDKPRSVAERLQQHLRLSDICESIEIAGPGFLNLRLSPAFVSQSLSNIAPVPQQTDAVDRLGIPEADRKQTVVVDFSSPNLAKEMHVGHLRTTIIGDCICRILEFQGHTVHRINHVGDWGTQFGMLIEHVRTTHPQVLDNPESLHVGDLESFYIAAKNRFDGDPEFADRARRAVVKLQSGDPPTLAVWRAFCRESLRHCHEIYDRLGVKIVDQGESFYNDVLPGVVEELRRKGFVVESEGAQCIFLDQFTGRDGKLLPMIVQKGDGGYNYDTTDLAALRYRRFETGADRLTYITDSRQKLRFEMLRAVAIKAGWLDDAVTFEHIGYGMMLNEQGLPFKTRDGGTIKLHDLLDEAVARARAVIEANRADPQRGLTLGEDQIDQVAESVGIGAVKYFDLSHNLSSDYKFDWDTMLSLDGNTAPYLMYAYARIRSIGRKAGIDFAELPGDVKIEVDHPAEAALAKKILQFAEIVEAVGKDLRPSLLVDYLFELSKTFSVFYDRVRGVRVIDAEPPSLRLSRLRLCDLTARALRLGLSLLGIGTVEQM